MNWAWNAFCSIWASKFGIEYKMKGIWCKTINEHAMNKVNGLTNENVEDKSFKLFNNVEGIGETLFEVGCNMIEWPSFVNVYGY